MAGSATEGGEGVPRPPPVTGRPREVRRPRGRWPMAGAFRQAVLLWQRRVAGLLRGPSGASGASAVALEGGPLRAG
eukprot:11188095-Lingulodinium_polyedra.AAC.1